MTRICRIVGSGQVTNDDEFHLPVFVFVFTKFRKLPNARLVNTFMLMSHRSQFNTRCVGSIVITFARIFLFRLMLVMLVQIFERRFSKYVK